MLFHRIAQWFPNTVHIFRFIGARQQNDAAQTPLLEYATTISVTIYKNKFNVV